MNEATILLVIGILGLGLAVIMALLDALRKRRIEPWTQRLALLSGGFFTISFALTWTGGAPGPGGGEGVTLGEYNDVTVGLSYEQVVNLVGFQGQELGQSVVPEATGQIEERRVLYEWRNPDGSGMRATFQNGRLTETSQLGLE